MPTGHKLTAADIAKRIQADLDRLVKEAEDGKAAKATLDALRKSLNGDS